MLQNIDQDRIEVKKQIDASLRRLEEQKLIIKNGDLYIFLTNEEQDVNREIKEIHIDQSELVDRVGNEIFNVLFGINKKYRYNERHDFGFNTYIDDRPIGTQRDEIGLRVVSPFYAHGGAEDMELKSLSIRERNVIAALPADTAFFDEMEQSMQIDVYIRRNSEKTSSDTIEDIKTSKIRESKQRAGRCRDLITEALKKAALYVNGNRLDIKEKQPEQRINEAFKTLVESIYSKLNYVAVPYLTAEDLRAVLLAKDNQQKLDGVQETEPNHLALTEMLDVIERSHIRNLPVTMRSLSEQFGKIPYGWKDMDIAGILTVLFKKQKIRFEMNGEDIGTNDLGVITYLTKREYIERLVVKWREIIDPALIANARDIAKEVFGRSDVPGDEDGLMRRIKEDAAAELTGSDESIIFLLREYANSRYPGKPVLENGKKLIDQIGKQKNINAFYEYLYNEKELLLDYEEDVLSVKNFFKNQRTIFDSALKMLDIYEQNRSFVLDPETINYISDIETIIKMKSPYPEIQRLPELIDKFRNRFAALLEDECEPIRESIKADYEITSADLGRRTVKDKFAEKVRSEFEALLDRLSRANSIIEAIGMRTESDRMKQRFIQQFIDSEAMLFNEKNKPDGGASPVTVVAVRRTKTVSIKSLIGGTSRINGREDINKLLDELRVKLEAQLEDDTTIQIV
jgi:hypothetical protein